MHSFAAYIKKEWLVYSLILLFVVQNQLFNRWVDIVGNPDIIISLLESATFAALMYGPALLFRRHARYAYLIVASLIVALVFCAQFTYFAFFGGFMQASALKYAGQTGAEMSTIRALLSPKLIVFVLHVILVVWAYLNERKTFSASTAMPPARRAVTFAVVLMVALFGYGLLFGAGENALSKLAKPKQTLHDLNSFAYAPNYVVQRAGIHNYFFGDVIGMMLRTTHITPEDVAFVNNLFAQKEAFASGPAAEKPRNLIVLQVESLEEAVIGERIGGKEITPRLNSLRSEGVYFNNYYTQIGPGNTADAEFVTLNSLYPLANTVAFIDFAKNTYSALPKLLRQNGYHTFVLHGDVPTFWNRANIYPSLGYDTSISKNDFTVSEKEFETLSDNDFLRQSAEKMKTFPQPFMATLITLSSHSPYVIPEEFQKLAIPEDSALSEMQKNYLQSVHYADAAIGEFIDSLKKEGLYDNALIVIYGDHGSFTGISRFFRPTQHEEFADMRASRVPLLLIAPNDKRVAKNTMTIPASHVDLYPTVARLLNQTPPDVGVFGQDMLTTKTPIVTRRDPYLQVITEILTPTLVYKGTPSGVFLEGTCYALPGYAAVELTDCKSMYDEQSANFRASDLIIRGNLLPIIGK